MSDLHIGSVTAGFDGVWSQPTERVAVLDEHNHAVKVYSPWLGDWLAKLLANLYIARH